MPDLLIKKPSVREEILKEKKMSTKEKITIGVLIGAFIGVVLLLILSNYIVKDNADLIRCIIKDRDEPVEISKDRIELFQDGVWYFDNGYASNCEIID